MTKYQLRISLLTPQSRTCTWNAEQYRKAFWNFVMLYNNPFYNDPSQPQWYLSRCCGIIFIAKVICAGPYSLFKASWLPLLHPFIPGKVIAKCLQVSLFHPKTSLNVTNISSCPLEDFLLQLWPQPWWIPSSQLHLLIIWSSKCPKFLKSLLSTFEMKTFLPCFFVCLFWKRV